MRTDGALYMVSLLSPSKVIFDRDVFGNRLSASFVANSCDISATCLLPSSSLDPSSLNLEHRRTIIKRRYKIVFLHSPAICDQLVNFRPFFPYSFILGSAIRSLGISRYIGEIRT